MEIVRMEQFSFAYPKTFDIPAAPAAVFKSAAAAAAQSAPDGARASEAAREGLLSPKVLSDVSFSVDEGAFCVLVGPTGCGKTTLLRNLKPELAPVGKRRGCVSACGTELVHDGRETGALDARASAELIGFVMQDPDAQIVCDTVWHEIAFGLENIGMAQDDMRRRIAEVVHFFGIELQMNARTETLSGGQKQLLNLAGVLALRPRLLLLDEPTAQLDPHAARQFLMMLARVNRELGLTVIMATHSPESVEDITTQRIVLGELGSLKSRASLEDHLRPRWRALPQGTQAALPTLPPFSFAARSADEVAIEMHDVYFRYERDNAWVLRGVDACVRKGSVHAFVGGNGCGKSTLLKVMAGILKAQCGSVRNALSSNQAMLPQEPKALLVCDSVAEELAEWRGRCGYTPADEAAMLERFELSAHAFQYPYDLSGGQQQKLALAKLLLTGARLLMLDEPTKGLDPASCADVVRIVRSLSDEGRTVVLVTHDLDFVLACADEVSMLFDGELACTQPVGEFFADNLIYRPHEESRLFGALV